MNTYSDIALCLCNDVVDEVTIRESVRGCVYDLQYIHAHDVSHARAQLNGASPSLVFVDYARNDGNAHGVEVIEELRSLYPLAYFALVSSDMQENDSFWVRGADFLTISKVTPEMVSEIYMKVLSDRERRRRIIQPFRALAEELRRQSQAYALQGVA